jgi:hypothetical protein
VGGLRSDVDAVEILAGRNSQGDPVLESIPAEKLASGIYRLLASPGLALGAAAGDEVEVHADGSFTVVKRGGNLAIHVLAETFDPNALADLEARVRAVGGYLDGGHDRLRVFTIPATMRLPTVEALFSGFASQNPGAEWWVGNTHDPSR